MRIPGEFGKHRLRIGGRFSWNASEELHKDTNVKKAGRPLSTFLMAVALATTCSSQAPQSAETKPELLPFAFYAKPWSKFGPNFSVPSHTAGSIGS